MVSGMYIPLELWRLLLKSSVVRGPKGGVAMLIWHDRRFAGKFSCWICSIAASSISCLSEARTHDGT